jgi:hypothetical protein
VALVDQWREIERELPADWADARLRLTVANEEVADRAAFLLGPSNPFRRGNLIRFYCARGGAGIGPEGIVRLLRRLDLEHMGGELELVGSGVAEAAPEASRRTLAATWQAAIDALPTDWSDVYAEVELTSTDYLERAALLLSPVNPARFGGKPGFRFRAANRYGYGVSAAMARRCFERVDSEGITGEVRILHALSDVHPVATQGPVWYVGGKSV